MPAPILMHTLLSKNDKMKVVTASKPNSIPMNPFANFFVKSRNPITYV
jgi:hypothetical protein